MAWKIRVRLTFVNLTRIGVDTMPRAGHAFSGNIMGRYAQLLCTMDAAPQRLFICLICCLIFLHTTPCFSNEKFSGKRACSLMDYDVPAPSRISALPVTPELAGSTRVRSHRIDFSHGAVPPAPHRLNHADFVTVCSFNLANILLTVPLPSARGFIFFSTPPPTA